MDNWILIDFGFRDKLPKEDCQIWITRICSDNTRWVQKVDYYADTQDIEWDGAIAWMIVNQENDGEPAPCNETCFTTIQNVR